AACTMLLGLAACGGSSSGSTAESTPASSAAAQSTPAESTPADSTGALAVAGGDPAEHTVEAIQEKGVLVVTTEAGYAPFEFLDDEGNIVGLDASLAQQLAADLGVELDMQNIAFDMVVSEVQAGNADMAIAGLTPNSERKQSVD